MRTLLTITMIGLFAGFVLTGCNTVEGMGRDIEKAGESIQKL